MIEVLVIGLVGLTYTCVQTLFFLNCLNSRRREQRRLEKAYRESIRKLKGGEIGVTGSDNHKKGADGTHKESRGGSEDVEKGGGGGGGNDESPEEDGSQGRLVTRLVVTSGKETLPSSQERAQASLQGVKVHKAVVKLSPSPSADKKGSVSASPSGSQRSSREGNGGGSRPIGPQREETGAQALVGNESHGYNITINSNMIEVTSCGDSMKDPIYESLDGDPVSILTQVTVCEDQEVQNDCLTLNKRSNESVSVDMVNGFKPQEVESKAGSPSYGTNDNDDDGIIGKFQEVQERRMEIDDLCNTEDEMDSFYQKSMSLPKRGDINLVTTISQILCSPPESMEPGNENHPLESVEPRVADLEFQAKSDNHNVSSRSHSANQSTDEQQRPRPRDSSVFVEASETLPGDYLSKQQRGESRREVTCYEKELPLKYSKPKAPMLPPRGKGSTWTLPRSNKHIVDGRGSLPRPNKGNSGSSRVALKESKKKEANESHLFNGQTWLHPRGGHSLKRDVVSGGGPLTQMNTCHSTPDMAGAATTAPLDTIGDSSNASKDWTKSVSASEVEDNERYDAPSSTPEKNLITSLQRKKVKYSKSDEHLNDLKVMNSDPGSSHSHSDEHTDSEESADSLYYTASDHTNSDAYSEHRGDSEENLETLVYESIGSEINTNQNVTMSVNQSEPNKDRSFHNKTNSILCPEELRIKEPVKGSDPAEDAESIGSESPYEIVSDSDHHPDSGYESPVKADVHSSDDTASTISSASSVENHYEDIDPARLERARQASSSRRGGRPQKESSSPNSSSNRSPTHTKEQRQRDDDEDSIEARQRQRLQELDDLIAGVPPPDYDVRKPLQDGSASSDVRASGQPGNIPPPPEFGDTSSGSGDSRNDEIVSAHRHLHATHSMPPKASPSHSGNSHSQHRSPLVRTSSEPSPPPPPPLPTHTPSPKSSPAITHRGSLTKTSSASSHENHHASFESRSGRSEGLDEESVIRPSEFIRRNSQRGENGSFRGHRKVDRPVSLPLDVAEHYGKIMSDHKDRPPSTTQDDSSSATLPAKSHLSNGKSMPFIPPKFPSQPSGSGLIKPSEYLKSLSGTAGRSGPGSDVKSLVALHSPEPLSSSFDTHDHASSHSDSQPASMPPGPLPSIPEATEEEPSKNAPGAPPPPPAPPGPLISSSANTLSRSNTLNNNTLINNNNNNNNNTNGSSKSMLPTISVTDLQSVQLRKTEAKVTKTTSVPLHIPLGTEPAIKIAKNDVIAELKMGVDITGIKKLKNERAREDLKNGKIEKEELERQFSPVNFVEKIAERDNAGNRIPEWKRQMLARKAAERAKKDAEERLQQQLEEKRLQSIPPWKRQLLNRRDDDGKRNSLYIPKVEDAKKIHVVNSPQDISRIVQKTDDKDVEENQNTEEQVPAQEVVSIPASSREQSVLEQKEEEEEPQMPWRTNLRKTKSKLSLLE